MSESKGAMGRRKIIFLSGSVILLSSLLLCWVFVTAKPPLTITVSRNSTNGLPDITPVHLGSSNYVRVVIAVTNNSRKTIQYWGGTSSNDPTYVVLRETSQGWGDAYAIGAGSLNSPFPLPPGQGFTFVALVTPDRRSKILFAYSNGQKPSPIWRQLPNWLWTRLPWASSGRTATSEVFDPRPPYK